MSPLVYLTLLHSPVYNKDGQPITSAVTNLDIHDISRLARTYGCKAYYIVTPLPMQQKLVQRLLDHWITGRGATWNQTRHEAFGTVFLAHDIREVKKAIEAETGKTPQVIATTARVHQRSSGFAELREKMQGNERPWLIAFGTGWGLVDEFLDQEADYVLAPIIGADDYNHLSVRCAAAIILDRLLGPL